MIRHTPGPWTMERYGDGDTLVVHSNEVSRVCFMATPGSNGDPGIIEADAHLICAAPDMLDALKVALGHLTGGMDGDWRNCDPRALIRAVIAKAEPLMNKEPHKERTP